MGHMDPYGMIPRTQRASGTCEGVSTFFGEKQAGNLNKSRRSGKLKSWIVGNSMIPSQPLKQKTFKKVVF